ncbi:MAG TPA: hypothetical protein PLP20_03050 [Oscillospiraceae bacterium]|nr:hypothetical protein [Oscillospiraceae bacterium]
MRTDLRTHTMSVGAACSRVDSFAKRARSFAGLASHRYYYYYYAFLRPKDV